MKSFFKASANGKCVTLLNILPKNSNPKAFSADFSRICYLIWKIPQYVTFGSYSYIQKNTYMPE